MNIKAWMPLGVAIVLGGIAAKVGREMMVHKEATTQPVTVQVTQVAVAKEAIAPGTALKLENLGSNSVPEANVPIGAFREKTPLVNRVVTVSVMKGQPILENMLAPQGSSKGLTAIVPDGMRAVTLEVNEVSGVAGMLVPGCRIDLVTTMTGDAGQMVARTIARNLQIVAVGRRFNEGGKEDPAAASDAAPARSVTLLATPRQAETIDLASHTGTPRIVLRGSRESRGDAGTDGNGVTVAELRGVKDESGESKGIFQSLMGVFAKSPSQPTSLFNDTPTPTKAKAVEPTRSVIVIRNTKETAVQLDRLPGEAKAVVPVAGTDQSFKDGN